MRVNEKMFRAFFESYCLLIPEKKLATLFDNLGFGDWDVTPDNCYKLYKRLGAEFGVPFGQLAQKAMKTPKGKAYFKETATQIARRAKLNKATDEPEVDDGYTQEEKAQMGLSYLELIMKYSSDIAATIVKGGTADDIVITPDKQVVPVGTDKESPWTKWLLIGGIALLVIVLVVVLIFKK